MKGRLILAIVSCCVGMWLFNTVLYEYLFEISLKHTIWAQTHINNPQIDLFMEALGYLGDKYGLSLTIILSFSLLHDPYVLLVLLELTYLLIIGFFMKALFKQPRPNFISSAYTASICAHDYGFPSLHTCASLGLALAFIKNLGAQNRTNFKFFWVFGVLLSVVISYS